MLTFLRSASRSIFPLGFLCANLGLAYFENSSTLLISYLCVRDSSTINFFLTWIGISFVYSQNIQLCRLLVRVSIWCLCSSQYLFCVWQKCYGTRLDYLQWLVFLFLLAVYWSNQIRWSNLVRDSVMSFRFKFSFFLTWCSSLRIRACIGVWSSISSDILGVGNQKTLFY